MVSSRNGIWLTIGFLHDANRFQIVMPYLSSSSLVPTTTLAADIDDFVVNQFYPAWKDCFATDVQMMGYQYEPLRADTQAIPGRVNFAEGDFPGTISGDSTPSQTSMLLDFYSEEQIIAGGRTRVAKQYIGPGAESDFDSGVISAPSLVTELTDLANLLRQWTSIGGDIWIRGLGPITRVTPPPGEENWYTCDFPVVRRELFTQRRRMRPLV